MNSELFFNKEARVDEQVFLKVKNEYTSKTVGYYSLPFEQELQLDEIERIAASKKLESVVVIGIGGSSLGAKAIDRLLKHKKTSKTKLLFLENSDPVELEETLKEIDLERTNFIVTSKSGSTIETLSIFKYVIALYGGISACADKIFAVTDLGSNLDRFAAKHGIKAFHIYPNVGGRFSVLSVVGLLPLALAGYDVRALLAGARSLAEDFFSGSDKHELLKKAAFLASAKEKISVLFAYGNEFSEFTKWFVQLWGESLGKINESGDFVGLTPIGIIGSIDQHSFLQLIMEGPRDKTVTFIKVKDLGSDARVPEISLDFLEKTDFVNGKKFNELLSAQCDATQEALRSVGVNTDLIELERLDEHTAGYLIYYYELLTSLVGAHMKINTYNQPGVELGKKILEKRFA
ncbi:MAG: glucose-6-phosphate isomerase [Helicobacteraceae bacterium]